LHIDVPSRYFAGISDPSIKEGRWKENNGMGYMSEIVANPNWLRILSIVLTSSF
jgi:hypothetical protein